MRKCSIIIPTHNKREFLEYTLRGYQEQTFRQFELVIVNNGCSDGTGDLLREFSDTLEINEVRLESKVESPTARNAGLKAARYDQIIQTDDDRIPCPRFVEAHLERLQDTRCISIGGKHPILTILKKRTPLWQFTEDYSGLQEELKQGDHLLLSTPDDIQARGQAYFDPWNKDETPDNFPAVRRSEEFTLFLENFGFIMATGGNCAYNKTRGAGVIFDEAIKGWGCDDNDFFYRLHSQGYYFSFNNEARNYHQEHPRRDSERDELRVNLKYLCHKYNRLEFYLWARTFMDESEFTHLDGDRFYRLLSQDSSVSADYIGFLTGKLDKHFW
ncbi:glycosyltransferase family 2 protein [Paenibacillus sp. GCM10012306]|uniref:glycosyltransferase family 2 protein n=1 Tax=Paenibacillus sp. GCM10012306 TaxID=3317342 RepID=UPI0036159C16